jgi:predicted lipoprotein
MKRLIGAGSLAMASLLLAGCGGGSSTSVSSSTPSPTPAPSPGMPGAGASDDDARRAVLASIGDKVILPTLRSVDAAATAMAAAVDTHAAAPADAAVRTVAQTAWKTAMSAVQRAEVMQIGPGAFVTDNGGKGLRLKIYAFPQFDACAVLGAAYAAQPQAITDSTPLASTGMGALEYLLFTDGANPSCPVPAGADAAARRAQHAARLARRVASVATELRTAWEPSGGNFVAQLATAGAGGMTYSTPQMAMDAVSSAIFYFEKQTKDRKLAAPTGFGATDIVECPTASCPDLAESKYARVSRDNIRENLFAFRDILTGLDGGQGLNALMQGVGRADLVARLATMIQAAIAVEASLASDLETAVAQVPSRNDCILAATNRRGPPIVCEYLGRVDDITDTLRTEIVSTLNLRVPDYAAGDND